MKLYLCSGFRHSYQKIIEHGCDLSWKKVGAIWNAADVYGENLPRVQLTKDLLSELWCVVVDIDLRSIEPDKFSQSLDDIDILFVNGWNTAYLIKLLHDKWLYDILYMRLTSANKTYIWSSAWTCIIWTHVKAVQFLEKHYILDKEIHLDWMAIIPHAIVLHWGNSKYVDKFDAQFITNFTKESGSLLLINDEQVIYMNEKNQVSML